MSSMRGAAPARSTRRTPMSKPTVTGSARRDANNGALHPAVTSTTACTAKQRKQHSQGGRFTAA
uniref:Uncharacterized protein n=1 Tax=Oryza barthii TaxID=65489 RepID=A0A0D3HSL1_9ORYZ